MEVKSSLKVLNIGNSFTDSLRAYFPQVVESAGCELKLEAASHGGCELHRHWDYISNEENDGVYSMYQDGRFKMREILARESWDYVSIQQASHYSWKPETYQPFATNIFNYIKRFAPQAQVVVQQTWAYRSDDPRLLVTGLWGINQSEMYERLTGAYCKVASELGVPIVPTGYAVQLARQKQEKSFENYDPALINRLQWPDLPPQAGSLVGRAWWAKNPETGKMGIKRDCIHLNARGQFLQACVWFASLYKRPVAEITFQPAELSNDDIEFLKGIAQEAVDTFPESVK